MDHDLAKNIPVGNLPNGDVPDAEKKKDSPKKQ